MREGSTKHKLQVIPLGGLGEIGKNMTVFEYGEDIVVVDAGLTFPDEDMPGIDIVIPDITYLLERREKVRGIVITHGHEDHVGALPYLLRSLDVPVHGSRLALGLIEGKLSEHGRVLHPGSRRVRPGDSLSLGCFEVGFFRTNHSIADAMGITIQTPVGLVVHTGDFKFDQTPVDGEVADLHTLAAVGQRGVLLMLADSTNAERPGFTPSEREVGRHLDEIFRVSPHRVIVATFASNVHRIQQVFDAAVKQGRKVAVVGRSIVNVVDIALELGYLTVPPGLILDIDEANKLPAGRVALLTTGSQGEPLSALTRMSMDEHRKVELTPGDTVVVAATPVPGNEKMVARTIDNLCRRGAKVIYGPQSGVHVSGHASREELKLILNLVKPKFLMPIHGEYRHLVAHAELARELGMPGNNILIGENGTIFEFGPGRASVAGKAQSGRVLIDGLGVGDVGNVVLKDRRQLAQDGLLVAVVVTSGEDGGLVAGPEIVSRGFVYVRESEALLAEVKARIRELFDANGPTDAGTLRSAIRDSLGKFLYERTHRRPVILPVVIEV
ncbi:MAG: ribonuclease J [Bacillota bacterium]